MIFALLFRLALIYFIFTMIRSAFRSYKMMNRVKNSAKNPQATGPFQRQAKSTQKSNANSNCDIIEAEYRVIKD